HTYLFKDGEIIARKTNGFSVRKIGFESFLGLASRQQPLLYGLVCVVLAVFTGWLGGVVFRR
ncbi:MAG: TIGR02186 family protein, partial [Devosia sp.]|nr:TIGR02186 family protein [Devosia sp.]